MITPEQNTRAKVKFLHKINNRISELNIKLTLTEISNKNFCFYLGLKKKYEDMFTQVLTN